MVIKSESTKGVPIPGGYVLAHFHVAQKNRRKNPPSSSCTIGLLYFFPNRAGGAASLRPGAPRWHRKTLTKLLGVLEVRENVSEETRTLAEELLRQMRLLIQFSYIPNEFPRGIAAAIENLTQGTERSAGVPVSFHSDEGSSRLDVQPEGTVALHRIAQEALANALKHSHATKIAVHMETAPDLIALRVEDDGVGFDAGRAAERPGRLGLLGMRRRAASVSGKLEITSTIGRGTTTSIAVPSKNPIANSTE